MAFRGQRFTLDPDADDFTFNIGENRIEELEGDGTDFIKEIRERQPTGLPPPPKQRQTNRGFPQHRTRGNASVFKSQRPNNLTNDVKTDAVASFPCEPSDRAIINQISRKYGIDPESKEKAEISEENKRRIAQMTTEDIQEARSQIMSNLSPAFVERLLKRANIEDDQNNQDWDKITDPKSKAQDTESIDGIKKEPASPSVPSAVGQVSSTEERSTATSNTTPSKSRTDDIEPQFQEAAPSLHFPKPFRNPDNYVALDPDSPSFLADLKKHYFPELPDDPSSLAWLQDPTEEESNTSPYAPTQTRYAPSDIRFDFTGRLIAPNESREIPVSKGLHHHGEAPDSAGYTVPELSILAMSALPNQRCVAYQVLGRILFRLSRGDFGPRGSELVEGLWACVEHERPLEIIMSEANRSGGGHMSAKAYATEALWLWRKGGGGERGILKAGETIAK